ncbi:MAG: hypothetical protein CM15mP120_09900 [Pseudomonadota bacterium]|nr:MAG: hypothetical protein CM15mP120_09900 [Pseudomonadota bacterium]
MWCCLPAPDPMPAYRRYARNVFEPAGLATVVLTPMKEVAERMRSPGALHTRFPLDCHRQAKGP